ncbi:MAG: LysR family transcriptional regulator [Oxalobacter sp.]|nr:LysR family transcriptional regulator [Oxalobacter sp.]
MKKNLLEAMRIFVNIVETGSMAKAAERLSLHRPAVTLALQQLEQALDVRLLHRTTRKLDLSPEGRAFYHRCKSILADIEETFDSFKDTDRLQGTMRIDLPVVLANSLVVPSLHAFFQQHPDLQLVLTSTDRLTDLVAEGLDCTVRIGELGNLDYVARPLGFVEMVTCASPAYLDSHAPLQQISDLEQHDIINFFNSQNRQVMDWQFQQSGQKVRHQFPSKMLVDDSDVLLSAALAGLGIVQGLRLSFQPYLESGKLVPVLLRFPVPPKKVSLLYPYHQHPPRKVRILGDWLEELLQKK